MAKVVRSFTLEDLADAILDRFGQERSQDGEALAKGLVSAFYEEPYIIDGEEDDDLIETPESIRRLHGYE